MVIMKGQKTGNLYKLIGNTVVGGASVSTHASSSNDNSELWHKRLGHLSEGGMLELHKCKLLQGVKSCKLDFCKFCVFGKQKRVSFKVSSHTSKGVLDYIHSDIWGPIKHISNGGARYFVTFIDDFSRKTGKKLKYFRSDNGMEYKDEEFLQFCKDKGIIRHFSVKRTPEQNGAAERMNITLLELARCMRLNADLPKSFWAEVVNTACYLINRSPSSAINHQFLEEVWSGKQVNFSAMRIFSCLAYVHLQNEERSKLDPKSKECIFLGYEEGVKGYRLWDPVAKKKVISKDVVLNEAQLLNTNATSSERQGHTVEIELHEQRTKSANESTDGSIDKPFLEDQEEHPSDSWNLVRDRKPRALVALDGLKLAQQLEYERLCMEGDAADIILALKSREANLSKIGHIVDEIKKLAESFQEVQILHVKRTGNIVAHFFAKEALFVHDMKY
ncbi:hypothetical protein RJ639_038658 [Escallonia herrerae]|uniref:Integrase catalytic domain-containing protein n=1 Tax=Escallonia herrerae TaxID=1293975 RepID=A0AA89BE15_9ASTE|nr:hypothetical protein RJ639_038658 [Escallonia herrerae]